MSLESTGTHIILDLYEIEDNEILKNVDSLFPIMDKIVDEYKLNVVAKASHQFQPFGATIVYVLAESHISIHTFVEERKIAMDLYTCSSFKNPEEIPTFVRSLFHDKCKIRYKIIER
jgi:S-adenosylmethionine decarboxylase proenzyme